MEEKIRQRLEKLKMELEEMKRQIPLYLAVIGELEQLLIEEPENTTGT